MEIPSWWLYVSGAFFILGLISFAALTLLILRLLSIVNELKPRVDRISERVEAISAKVDSMADSAKGSVERVSNSTKGITQSIDSLVTGTTGKMQQITSILGVLMTGYQLFQQFQAMKAAKKHDEDDD